MADEQLLISEEYVDNEPIGVEAETSDEAEEAVRRPEQPWDPTLIRVQPRNYSLRNIIDFVNDGTLELFPDFQRNKVWGHEQRSRLIESILLQIPLPAFYFVEERDLSMKVVDGLQRLSAIRDFVRGDFRLVRLEYMRRLENQTFAELDKAAQRRIYSSQINVNVVDPTTPAQVKFNIYKRINTGGAPLNLQEIRHAMANQRSRDFLARLTAMDEFQDAVNGTKLAVRMADRELVLRFCALAWHDYRSYPQFSNMEALLDEMSESLGDSAKISDAELAQLSKEFMSGLRNAAVVFGRHAFRKWPLGQDNLYPFNRTLFESWCYALRDAPPGMRREQREQIAVRARELMTNDQAYIQAITAATGDYKKLDYRFKAALRVVRDAVGTGEDVK